MRDRDRAAAMRAAELLALEDDASDQAISQTLQREGFSLSIAERALALIAFGRAFLPADPPDYAATYEIRDVDLGRSRVYRVADDPLYEAALEEAEAWSARPDRTPFLRVVAHSAEVDAVRQLCGDGTQPGDLVLSDR